MNDAAALQYHGTVGQPQNLLRMLFDDDGADATGAGDVFAAAFFVRLLETRDPWEAARFANRVAAVSVTRPGLQGIPTPTEVQQCLIEVLR